MRKKIVAGNWKMNLDWNEAKELIQGLNNYLENNTPTCEVVICPPAIYAVYAKENASPKMEIGVQNISENSNGAYTGEISGNMLQTVKIDYSIVGHSERRSLYHETSEQIGKKAVAAIKNGIKAIICCGETLEERKAGKHKEVVKSQLVEALRDIDTEDMAKQVIAYEPVWAIGTGETATPEQAQEMHEFIRKEVLSAKYGNDIANQVRILYGGSVKPTNAEEIFNQKDIDGGLIGGASLKASDFSSLIDIANKSSH